jgi:hypothetical protein
MRILGRLAVAAGATAVILLAAPAANAAPSMGNVDGDMPRSLDLLGVVTKVAGGVGGGLTGGVLNNAAGLPGLPGLPGLGG